MSKMFILLFLSLSLLPIQAAEMATGEGPVTEFKFGDKGKIKGRSGTLHMRSVEIEDKEAFEHFLEQLEKRSYNPSAAPRALDTHVNRRAVDGNSYHMMLFSRSEDGQLPFAAVLQGPMAVFGGTPGRDYDSERHEVIIRKLRDLGVRQAVGTGKGAHDERIGNFGLLSFTPLIHPSEDEETRKNVYLSMINLAKTLRSQGKLMPLENDHKLECTDAAFPKHIVMALHPDFRDVLLLPKLGFTVDTNRKFEDFYAVPRFILTYDLTA
jgi:hypothetical protein